MPESFTQTKSFTQTFEGPLATLPPLLKVSFNIKDDQIILSWSIVSQLYWVIPDNQLLFQVKTLWTIVL